MTEGLTLALPPGYRSADVLAFHARDAEGLAERVEGSRLRKAVLLGGVPLLFDLTLEPTRALCRIDADAPLDTHTRARAHAARTASWRCASTRHRLQRRRATTPCSAHWSRAPPACASCSRPASSRP
ncbi:hypothetical protein [Massilia sp. Se16.2.3]|uniref:hypothetical protein n=1 Tax=Massilia sp. Se16.2.3 TaxID=2709303 RepID=UPI00280501C0|nr:hypothetical protein [Massilia sp. Se16.2.3]